MSFERVVALNVVDLALYQKYRDEMAPILKAHGGGFRYDFTVSKTLTSEASHPINRLFVISFPDQESHDRFFANPDYKKIRATYFEPAVQGVTLL